MTVEPPTSEELQAIAAEVHLDLRPDEIESFRTVIDDVFQSYKRLDELPEPRQVIPPRDHGRPPTAAENPFGAWLWRGAVEGNPNGPLAGRTVVLKDTICLAGAPLTNGSRVMEGYVPEFDATVVSRVLDAGGTIVGKAVCENLSASGGSHTAATGFVRNPHRPTHSSGGSSSGCAALVAAGEVDLALGGDQGGSIRVPSAWCGIYGLKPTWGLVPYTGIFPAEFTTDHVGPMARSVSDLALLLDAIAGPDGLDPRQLHDLRVENYTAALTQDAADLRVGVLQEGFDVEGLSEPDVDNAVCEAAKAFARLGYSVRPISIPWHRDGVHVVTAIDVEGGASLAFGGNALGTNWKGFYARSLGEAFQRGLRERPNDLPVTTKLLVLTAAHLRKNCPGRYYARAQNLGRELTAAYDAALEETDILLLPTVPMKATQLPTSEVSVAESVALSLGMWANTCPFDVSGHPALNVPIGLSDGLPIGMMLVGRRWEDATVLRAAHLWETKVANGPAPVASLAPSHRVQA